MYQDKIYKVDLLVEVKFRIKFPVFYNMEGFFDIKETGTISCTEDFDVGRRVE